MSAFYKKCHGLRERGCLGTAIDQPRVHLTVLRKPYDTPQVR